MFSPEDKDQKKFRRYGNAPLLDERDNELSDFIDELISGGSKAVDRVRKLLTPSGQEVLRVYAERMASRVVRTNDTRLLVRATVALVLGGFENGVHESLIVMAPIEDAAKRVGVDLDELFEKVSNLVGHPGSLGLVTWLSRTPENRTLEVMNFIPGNDDGGFRYKFQGW